MMRAIPPETREELDKLERKNAENPEGRYFVPLANALRKAGDTAKAAALLRGGLDRHPDYVSAHIVLGRCLQDDGEMEAAESRFRHVLSIDPQNLVALRTLGDLAVASQREDVARGWYDQLLDVDPMNEEARLALAQLESSGHEPDEGTPHAGDSQEGDVADVPGGYGWTAPAGGGPALADEMEDQRLDDGSGGQVAEVEGEAEVEASSEGYPFSQAGQGSPVDEVMRENTMIGGDASQYDPDEPFGDEGAVITETIAELYTRQGFYERAAVVYRELIRRRGPDPGLEEQLARVERLSRGETDPDDDGESLSGTETTLGSGDAAEPEFQHVGEPSPPSVTGAVESPDEEAGAVPANDGFSFDVGFDHDPFAESFTEGFPTDEASSKMSEAGSAVEAPEEVGPLTIRDYLKGVLSWAPSSAEPTGMIAPDEAHVPESDDLVGSPDDTAVATALLDGDDHDFVEAYVWAERTEEIVDPSISHRLADDGAGELTRGQPVHEELEEPADERLFDLRPTDADLSGDAPGAPEQDAEHEVVSGAGAESGSEGALQASSPSDDDLFPWEQASAPTSGPATSDPPPVAAEDQVEASEVVEAFEARAPASDEPAPAPEESAEQHEETWSPEPEAAADATPESLNDEPVSGDEDDDDLESFQAWLRSLKR